VSTGGRRTASTRVRVAFDNGRSNQWIKTLVQVISRRFKRMLPSASLGPSGPVLKAAALAASQSVEQFHR
jgi:hypothetical protein